MSAGSLDGGDGLSLLSRRAGSLDAWDGGGEEGGCLFTVAFEVCELGAAVAGEGGEEALELGGGLVFVCMYVFIYEGWEDGYMV